MLAYLIYLYGIIKEILYFVLILTWAYIGLHKAKTLRAERKSAKEQAQINAEIEKIERQLNERNDT